MAQFRVIADKLWHSGECRHYHKGDVVTLPDTVVPKPDGAIEAIEPKAPAKGGKAKAAQTEGDKPEGGDETLA